MSSGYTTCGVVVVVAVYVCVYYIMSLRRSKVTYVTNTFLFSFCCCVLLRAVSSSLRFCNIFLFFFSFLRQSHVYVYVYMYVYVCMCVCVCVCMCPYRVAHDELDESDEAVGVEWGL